jgi:hypothetical protein
MTLPRERLSYSSPFTRPPLLQPGDARMIVWSVVNIEEWEITRPMARQISQPPMGQTAIPDMPNWTWYEYGMRVGWCLRQNCAGSAPHAGLARRPEEGEYSPQFGVHLGNPG